MALISLPILWAVSTLALQYAAARSQPRSGSQAGDCSASTFTAALPQGASVELAYSVPGGGSFGEGASNLGYPLNATNLPELCAVIIRASSSTTSSYRFGLFLPTKSNWNSRFLATGNGGFLGGIDWVDMAPGPRYGFATLSTDTGHNSASTQTWAYKNVEAQKDWGYRAMHGSIDLGKRLTAAYYGRDVAYSYYSGCSTGGRQGLKEIQISPNSFNGVLVGAPAWYTTGLMTWLTALGTWNLPSTDPKAFTTTAQYSLLASTVLSQCDKIDGLQDNIISTPEACKPDLSVVQCGKKGVDSRNCLTSQQIETAKKVWGDYYTSKGDLVYNGLELSGENQWDVYTLHGAADNFDTQWEKYWVYEDKSWNWKQYSEQVFYDSVRANPGNATADHFDISGFRSAGGKVILYQGLSDGLISARSSLHYYNETIKALGGGGVDDFFRYFQVPGMQHCMGSPAAVRAPWYIGSWGQPARLPGTAASGGYSVPGFQDPQHDALLALMRWTENGTAVDSIVATAWDDDADDLAVYRQRPICPYPKKATYDNQGNADLASSWTCK
ncbi:ferulic acid Esterase/Feruloyl esterase [Apiospora kogelbergensis]|uniref:ferulic acid Esterase/Feruloyl esterase n=1 Tax=Apiospora kogelbergensis TaxID=1337665 RepID=UPI00312F9643